MLTARGWWVLLSAIILLTLGVIARQNALALLGLAILFWLAYETARFTHSLYRLPQRLRLTRTLRDPRGPVRVLIGGGTYTVEVTLELDEGPGLLAAIITDRVPFAVDRTGGSLAHPCRLNDEEAIAFDYPIRCRHAGVARFEGLQVQVADAQGFFYHSLFLHQVIELPILPLRGDAESRAAQRVPSNRLPPPGQHRLRKPGASSELLDLRDYQPGDSPRTIAWKVSARRGKLITREFESEVPLRCTLFVDVSASVRLLSARRKKGSAVTSRPLHRIVDVAAGVVQAGLANRDLVGLCIFDETRVRYHRPDRAGRHRNEMLQALAETLRTLPEYERADVDDLVKLAYAFARQVYPELLDRGVNGMTWRSEWIAAFPGAWRRSVGLLRYLHRRKGSLLFLILAVLPAMSLVLNLFLGAMLPDSERMNLLAASVLGSSVMLSSGVLGYLLVLMLTGHERRQARWRKQLAALICDRYALGAGTVAALLEDEDLLALMIQKFLNEHQVPFRVPLYNEHGQYLHAAPEKVKVLTVALHESIRRGQDSELFVLMADLIELEDQLPPLLKAVRLARSRHHQVLVIIPWPPGLEPPGAPLPPEPDPHKMPAGDYLEAWVERANQDRFHQAYQRVKKEFTRLGVEVVCAEEDEPVNLVLTRLDRLRRSRRAF